MMFDRTASRARNVAASIRAANPALEANVEALGSRLTIARNVIRLRVQRGYTQVQLADILGVKQPRIAEIESARAHLKTDTIDRLAKAFGVEPASLLKRERAARGSIVSLAAVAGSSPASRTHSPSEWQRSGTTLTAAHVGNPSHFAPAENSHA